MDEGDDGGSEKDAEAPMPAGGRGYFNYEGRPSNQPAEDEEVPEEEDPTGREINSTDGELRRVPANVQTNQGAMRVEIVQAARLVEFTALPKHFKAAVAKWRQNVFSLQSTRQLDSMEWTELFAKGVFDEVQDGFIRLGWLATRDDASWKHWPIETLVARVEQSCPDATIQRSPGMDNPYLVLQQWVRDLKMEIHGLKDLTKIFESLSDCHNHWTVNVDKQEWREGTAAYHLATSWFHRLKETKSLALMDLANEWKAICQLENRIRHGLGK